MNKEPKFVVKAFSIKYKAVNTPSGIDEPFENWIEQQLKPKYRRWASGMEVATRIRDIAFERND